MKRAGDSDILPSPKRVRKEISITDSNLNEVRKQYHTDCEIIALNGEPAPRPGDTAPSGAPESGSQAAATIPLNPKYRVFPVNRLVLSGWTVPFSVFVDGQFAERHSGKIYLPYSTEIVSVLVQHMYYTCNMADVPIIAPEVAFPVMEIAHMYERMDLFELAEPALWKLEPEMFTGAGEEKHLVKRALALGVDPQKLYNAHRNAKVFERFHFDASDVTMKPFLAIFGKVMLRYVDPLAWSEYTEEIAISAMYSVWTPEQWRDLAPYAKKWRNDNAKTAERLALFHADVALAREVTKCGVISTTSMQDVLRAIIARPLSVGQATINEANRLLNKPNDYCEAYCALMRKVYPLPPKPASAP